MDRGARRRHPVRARGRGAYVGARRRRLARRVVLADRERRRAAIPPPDFGARRRDVVRATPYENGLPRARWKRRVTNHARRALSEGSRRCLRARWLAPDGLAPSAHREGGAGGRDRHQASLDGQRRRTSDRLGNGRFGQRTGRDRVGIEAAPAVRLRRRVGFGEDRRHVVDFLEVSELDLDRPVLFALVRRGVAEALRCLRDVALVRAFLDLAADARPVHRVGVELLRDDVEAEPERRVPDLLLSQDREAPVDVLALNPGLDLLVAHEVLLVGRTEAIDALFELGERDLELLLGVFRFRRFHYESDRSFEPSCRGVKPARRERRRARLRVSAAGAETLWRGGFRAA